MENITWIQRRGQIKHLLYELCLTGRIDKATLAEQFKDLNSVAPVEHGQWIDNTRVVGWPKWNCSVCGGVGRGDYKFCPWCRAKMDGKEE